MLGVLCGLESEAVIARRIKGALVVCAAARPELALRGAHELVRRGATQLLSFGLAGGLKPGLPVGSLIVGTHAQTAGEAWACDATWSAALLRNIPKARNEAVWGAESIVARAQDKRALYERTRCAITDMESHIAGRVAAEAALPFAVLRVVADPAVMDIPSAALVPLRDDGRVALRSVLRDVLNHPAQVPSLARLGLNTGAALRTLREIVSVVDGCR